MKGKLYLSDFPDLMLDWVPELNPDIDPATITAGSHRKIMWRCHKCGRVWAAQVNNRTHGTGCTCDANKRKTQSLRNHLVETEGSLATNRPEIAAQWHPTLNGSLTPNDVTEQSMFKAWWIDQDGAVWQSAVAVRCRKPGGTRRSNSLAVRGINDLKTLRPDLAAEWNYDRNENIDIYSVVPGSKRKVWWICEKGHEWQASVTSRNQGRGCPICNQERNTSFPEQAIYYYVKKVFTDAENRYYPEPRLEIDVFIPSVKIGIEYDGSFYHRTNRKKNADEKKNERLRELGITLIRVVEQGGYAPDSTDHIIECPRVNSEAQIDIALRELFQLLEKLSGKQTTVEIDSDRDRTKIYEQYVQSEKRNSIAVVAPNALNEWHPTKNGKIKPEYVQAMSNKRFWWKCKRCGYEWETPAAHRALGMGCPVCSGNVVARGFNDLPTVRPDLMEEWNIDRNTAIDPFKCTVGSNKKVWWRCKNCGYEWEAIIVNRSRGNACPACSGKITTKEKSLAAVRPDLAKQWASELNGELSPADVLPGSDQRVWWRCDKGHVWLAAVSRRVQNNNCPYCGNKRVLTGFNDFATVYPDLLKEWDNERNTISPEQILAGSNKKVFWKCEHGHSWEAAISNRIRGQGCPYCSGKRVEKGKTDLLTTRPELAAEWNTVRNAGLSPADISAGSNQKVWWKCSKCGGEWQAPVWSRAKGRGCPYCAGVKPIIGKTDLKTKRPDLISEWDYEKNTGVEPEQFMPNSRAKVWWKCTNCEHEWEASIGSRARGGRCPNCGSKAK